MVRETTATQTANTIMGAIAEASEKIAQLKANLDTFIERGDWTLCRIALEQIAKVAEDGADDIRYAEVIVEYRPRCYRRQSDDAEAIKPIYGDVIPDRQPPGPRKPSVPRELREPLRPYCWVAGNESLSLPQSPKNGTPRG